MKEYVPGIRQPRQKVLGTSFLGFSELALPSTVALNDTTITDVLAGGPVNVWVSLAPRRKRCLSTYMLPCTKRIVR